MTLDEAIEYERNNFYGEYHEHLAEWLELLKWYQQGMEDIPSESGVLPKDVYHAGYNKAIDDLKNKICMHFADWKYSEDDKCIKDIIELASESVEEIAEQLKEGEQNENDR